MTRQTRHFRFESASESAVGPVRAINEDSLLVDPDNNLWLVADGMGGHAAGDYASQAIVDHMRDLGRASTRSDLKERFVSRLNEANANILRYGHQLGRGSIGSTIAALLVHDDRFACFWSGDSRVYRLRDQELRRVTKDHTEVQALLDAGAITWRQAETWPRKNVITHAIGVTEMPEFDVIEGTLLNSDVFLICSDGLTEYFGDGEIAHMLGQSSVGLESICAHFVREAIARGGKDNITVIVLRAVELDTSQAPKTGLQTAFGGLR